MALLVCATPSYYSFPETLLYRTNQINPCFF